MSLKWVCFVRLELTLSRPSACCRIELSFFSPIEREQRRLLGHSGDGHLGCQHNGLTRVRVFMDQVHTRLILQRAGSGDTLRVPCFDFLSRLIISWGLDGCETRFPTRSKVTLLSSTCTFSHHIFHLTSGQIILLNIKTRKKNVIGGRTCCYGNVFTAASVSGCQFGTSECAVDVADWCSNWGINGWSEASSVY